MFALLTIDVTFLDYDMAATYNEESGLHYGDAAHKIYHIKGIGCKSTL